MPENIKNKEYRAWYLETQYTLNLIKTGIHEKLLTKSRDLKSFVYLIYLVFSHAGFEISKGTKFSEYLALYLGESKDTIDKYIKQAAIEDIPLWKDEARRTQRLIAILMRMKSFNPNKETQDSLSKSIWEKIPKEISKKTNTEKRFLGELSPEEKTFYDQLEICFK